MTLKNKLVAKIRKKVISFQNLVTEQQLRYHKNSFRNRDAEKDKNLKKLQKGIFSNLLLFHPSSVQNFSVVISKQQILVHFANYKDDLYRCASLIRKHNSDRNCKCNVDGLLNRLNFETKIRYSLCKIKERRRCKPLMFPILQNIYSLR
jgi:isocitrate dehydrogenase kinase/phosphatase